MEQRGSIHDYAIFVFDLLVILSGIDIDDFLFLLIIILSSSRT